MTSKEIFQHYYKKKLIILVGIGIVLPIIRLLSGYETTLVFALTFVLCFAVFALIGGYIDFNFYEKSVPKIIAKLIEKEPLYSFRNIGFTKIDNNGLEGQMNNYKIMLSPVTNMEGDKVLSVLIPLQIREGLESYFTKYNDNFKFNHNDELIFAEAILWNYEKEYTYNKLFELIDKTTISLKENRIEPLNIVDD
jgi:hypothetical protein